MLLPIIKKTSQSEQFLLFCQDERSLALYESTPHNSTGLKNLILAIIFKYIDEVRAEYARGAETSTAHIQWVSGSELPLSIDEPPYFCQEDEPENIVSVVLAVMRYPSAMDGTMEYSFERLMESTIRLLFADCNILYLG